MRKASSEVPFDDQFPVVGIGASAGGLDAIKSLLKALPAKSGMAYVFVQHLSPQHESILPEILQKVTRFPVQHITDNVHLQKDHLYIIPENKIVTIADSALKLAPLNNNEHKKTNTIDLFFSSLGVVYQSYAVGVVLSGALNDGTLGLQVIKSYGGLTFAQDESSATFDSMPNSAVQAGVVDFILPPEKIAEQLIASNRPFQSEYTPTEVNQEIPQQDSEIFKQILTVLRVRRGVDFNYYKQSTLKRRIMRRMALNKIQKPSDYLRFLRENNSEHIALYNDMLISVTNFFRDAQIFETLKETIFPEIIRKKQDNEVLRIWVAGCATGEEAYSIGICLQEYFGDRSAGIKIQIFATDISETSIAKARTGVFTPVELSGVSSSRLQQFFTKLNGSYQVNKTIRDMCVFAHHNLLKDAPFSRIDLVSCRNVLIYLEPILQKRIFTTFNYSLNEGGYLMLGKTESIGGNSELFKSYKSAEKIYSRKGLPGRFIHIPSRQAEHSLLDIDQNIQKEGLKEDVFKMADEAMLKNFMPASVLVNEKFDIVQIRGSIDAWLIPPTGKPSLNVLKMAREGLSYELRNLLEMAGKTTQPVIRSRVPFNIDDTVRFVNLRALQLTQNSESYFLVVFQHVPDKTVQGKGSGAVKNSEKSENKASQLRIERLERELAQTRADMRAVADSQETANEELQSANEELLSGSEELQSLNEELETSKEELQSINEEIMIVNKEILFKNEQLNSARIYAEGIVNTIRDPLLILDNDFKIKRATNGFYKKFKTSEKETEGKYLFEINNGRWNIPRLRELLENILPAKKELEDFEVTQVFDLLGKRTMCLNARRIENITNDQMILLSIEDITYRRKVEEGLAEAELLLSESRERLKFAVESAGLGTWDFDPQSDELICDRRCREIFGLRADESVNVPLFYGLIHPDDRPALEKKVKEALINHQSGDFDAECRTVPIDGKYKWLRAKGRAHFNELGVVNRFIGTLLDITVQKLMDLAVVDLLKKKDEFISVASHELKTPITSLRLILESIEQDVPKKEETKSFAGALKKSIKQVDKLVGLIKDLLDVTKIQSGKMELKKSEFLLDGLIRDCTEEFPVLLTKHQINIEGDTNIAVNADRNRIEQVMINLISNAIKYSPNSDSVIVRIEKLDEGVKIIVIDFGIGIAENKLPMIFDRFYRVEERSQKYAGLGLGLYIASEIIRQHNGHINVESEVGKGSTFWFVLPC